MRPRPSGCDGWRRTEARECANGRAKRERQPRRGSACVPRRATDGRGADDRRERAAHTRARAPRTGIIRRLKPAARLAGSPPARTVGRDSRVLRSLARASAVEVREGGLRAVVAASSLANSLATTPFHPLWSREAWWETQDDETAVSRECTISPPTWYEAVCSRCSAGFVSRRMSSGGAIPARPPEGVEIVPRRRSVRFRVQRRARDARPEGRDTAARERRPTKRCEPWRGGGPAPLATVVSLPTARAARFRAPARNTPEDRGSCGTNSAIYRAFRRYRSPVILSAATLHRRRAPMAAARRIYTIGCATAGVSRRLDPSACDRSLIPDPEIQ